MTAMGYAGRYIFVAPKADLVVVFACWMPGADCFKPMQYLDDYIVRSIQYWRVVPHRGGRWAWGRYFSKHDYDFEYEEDS